MQKKRLISCSHQDSMVIYMPLQTLYSDLWSVHYYPPSLPLVAWYKKLPGLQGELIVTSHSVWDLARTPLSVLTYWQCRVIPQRDALSHTELPLFLYLFQGPLTHTLQPCGRSSTHQEPWLSVYAFRSKVWQVLCSPHFFPAKYSRLSRTWQLLFYLYETMPRMNIHTEISKLGSELKDEQIRVSFLFFLNRHHCNQVLQYFILSQQQYFILSPPPRCKNCASKILFCVFLISS